MHTSQMAIPNRAMTFGELCEPQRFPVNKWFLVQSGLKINVYTDDIIDINLHEFRRRTPVPPRLNTLLIIRQRRSR